MIINIGFVQTLCSKKEHLQYNESDHYFFENIHHKKQIKIDNIEISYKHSINDNQGTTINKLFGIRDILSATFEIVPKGNEQQNSPEITLFFDEQKFNSLFSFFTYTEYIGADLIINKFKPYRIRVNRPRKQELFLFNKKSSEITPINVFSSVIEFYYMDCEQIVDYTANEKRIIKTKNINYKCDACEHPPQYIEDKLISRTIDSNIRDETQVVQGIVQQNKNIHEIQKEIYQQQKQKEAGQCLCGNFAEFEDINLYNIYNTFDKIKPRAQFPMKNIIFTDNQDQSYFLELSGTKGIDNDLKDDFYFFVQSIYKIKPNKYVKIREEDIGNCVKTIRYMYVFNRENKLLEKADIRLGIPKTQTEQLNRLISLKFNFKHYPEQINQALKVKFLHQKDKLFSRVSKISDKAIAQSRLFKALSVCGGAGIAFAYAEETEKTDEDLAMEVIKGKRDE